MHFWAILKLFKYKLLCLLFEQLLKILDFRSTFIPTSGHSGWDLEATVSPSVSRQLATTLAPKGRLQAATEKSSNQPVANLINILRS